MEERGQVVNMPPTQSFSAAAAPKLLRDDFPALQTREEILIDNLLGMNINQNNKYTLMGLVEIIKPNNKEMTILSQGCDLGSLGLNLNAADSIYQTFMAPCADTQTNAEPTYSIPDSYILPHLPPALSKMSSLSDESLFYIFYSMPRDTLQECAAQELYGRSWRFHKEFKLWLCKDPQAENPVKGSGYERGVYIFFDPSSWTCVKKEWVLHYDQLEERMADGS